MSDLIAINNTESTITVSKYTIFSILSTDAVSVDIVDVINSSNNKFRCYKFLNDTLYYYYVVDGIQTNWVSDLNSIGYTEVPSIVLPEVVLFGNVERDYWLYVGSTISQNKTLSSGSNCPLYSDPGTSSYGWTTYPKAVISCQNYQNSEYWNVAKGRTGLSLVMSTLSGFQFPGCENILNDSITFTRLKAAYCRDDSVTVITVYNSNNVAYNAFKYTINNEDYYYVLDGIQTEWINDLVSIGYYPSEIEVLFGFKWNNNETALTSVTDLSYDYYWTRVINQKDKDLLTLMGIWYETSYKYGSATYDPSKYSYTFIAIYKDVGETIAINHDSTKCEIRSYSSVNNMGLYYNGSSNEAVMTWKCRITKHS